MAGSVAAASVRWWSHAAPIRDVVRQTHHERSCIFTVSVVAEVARYFGVRASPIPVQATHFNAEAVRQLALPDAANGLTGEAWTVGVGGTGKVGTGGDANNWDGHLVAVIGDSVLVDASADQFSRPQKAMVIGPFAGELAEPLSAQHPAVFTVSGQGNKIVYVPMETPGPWRETRDWRDHRQVRKEAVAVAVRSLR